MTTLTPKAHARLSPSGSKRWFACPGSLTLEAPYPDTSNEYSDDGTAMHEVAAWCLTEHHRAKSRVGEWIVVSRDDEPVRKVKFDEDMATLVQDYVDYVRYLGIGNELHVEQRLEFSKFVGEPPARAPTDTDPGADGQFGTTDAGIVNTRDGELHVIDLKTGHRPVEVEGNTQLLIYGLAMLGKLYEDAVRHESVLPPLDDDAPLW